MREFSDIPNAKDLDSNSSDYITKLDENFADLTNLAKTKVIDMLGEVKDTFTSDDILEEKVRRIIEKDDGEGNTKFKATMIELGLNEEKIKELLTKGKEILEDPKAPFVEVSKKADGYMTAVNKLLEVKSVFASGNSQVELYVTHGDIVYLCEINLETEEYTTPGVLIGMQHEDILYSKEVRKKIKEDAKSKDVYVAHNPSESMSIRMIAQKAAQKLLSEYEKKNSSSESEIPSKKDVAKMFGVDVKNIMSLAELSECANEEITKDKYQSKCEDCVGNDLCPTYKSAKGKYDNPGTKRF